MHLWFHSIDKKSAHMSLQSKNAFNAENERSILVHPRFPKVTFTIQHIHDPN